MMDYGEAGLTATRSALNGVKIVHVGAGDNSFEAQKSHIHCEDGKRIAIIACCEQQFGAATESVAGVAVMGEWVFNEILKLRPTVDYIIVTVHAALEDSPFPDPKLRRLYKYLIDIGADIIHGHHSHTPQGWEVYKDGVIFYGLGNFVVDTDEWSKQKNGCWSLAVNLNFAGDKPDFEVFYVTCEGVDNTTVLSRRVAECEKSEYEEYVRICNKALASDDACQAYWQEACAFCYSRLYGLPLRIPAQCSTKVHFRARARLVGEVLLDMFAIVFGKTVSTRYTQHRSLIYLNSYQCESHRNAIVTTLQLFGGLVKDLRTPETAADLLKLINL